MLRLPTLVVITLGYLAGAIAIPRLPGPDWPAAPTAWIPIVAIGIAFGLPTAAALLCSLLESLWQRDRIRLGDPTRDVIFHAIVLRLAMFVIAVHTLVVFTLAGAFSRTQWPARAVLVLLGVVIAIVGNLVPRIRQNIVFGLRTSLATSDAVVWAKTHRMAGCGMVLFGAVLCLVAVFAPGPLMPVIAVPTASAVAIAILLTHRRAASGSLR